MKEIVQNNILSWGFDKKSPLVIGVSGGPDSLTLLHILFVSGFNVFAVYIDHRLRDDARAEEIFVNEFCENREITYRGVIADTNKFVNEKGLSVEEAARILRYKELFKIANEVKAQAVCVAHNADDQIETVLMHLLRGSGLAGLRGMKSFTIIPEWDLEIPVIRPLISIWRKEIDSYCDLNGLTPVQDLSNLDNRFFRNKIRNELIPYLFEYNPNVRNSLFQMSEILSGDYEIIKGAAADAWILSVESSSKECVQFDRSQLSNYPTALQNYLFRKAMNIIRSGLRDINFNTFQIISNALKTKESGENLDLINDIKLTFNETEVYIHDTNYEFEASHGLQTSEAEIQLQPNKEYDISPNWKLMITPLQFNKDLMNSIKNNPDRYTAYVDASQIGDLFIRSTSEGVRFSPLGMDGHTVKLSDYFINQKVPRREREKWPILFSDHEIIWVIGYQISEKYQICEETKQILKISIQHNIHGI